LSCCFFFQAEDGIRAFHVTGVQTCALPIFILLPLAGLVLKAGGLGLQEFWSLVTSERALASYKVTLGSALGASVFNLFLGLLLRSEERRVGKERRSRCSRRVDTRHSQSRYS